VTNSKVEQKMAGLQSLV